MAFLRSPRNITYAFLLTILGLGNQVAFAQEKTATPFSSMQDAVASLENSLEKIEFFDRKVETSVKQSLNSKPGARFTEEELKSLVTMILNGNTTIPNEVKRTFGEISSYIAKRLCDYKVTGFAFAFDPNAALFWDNQNPSFTIAYKNNEGLAKTRTFDASINSIGLKIALSLNFNLIFFTGDLDFDNTNKQLQLGTGIDIDLLFPFNVMGIHHFIPGAIFLTQAPILNAPGNFVMLGFDFGLAGGISILTGGTLTPRD